MISVAHHKPEIILDESLYGITAPEDLTDGAAYSFYFYNKGKIDLITSRKNKNLIAVTKEQFNAWNSRTIIRIPVEFKNGSKSKTSE